MDTGKKVRQWRKDKGWNQAELARKAGISQETISSLERGRTVLATAATLQAVARALGRTMEEMLPDESERLAGLVDEITQALAALGTREPKHAERARELTEELRRILLDPGPSSPARPDTDPSPPARPRSGRK